VTEKTEIYGPLARRLHWLVAAAVLLQIAFGIVMTHDPKEPDFWSKLADALGLYNFHKLFGVVILALVVVRLLNRVLRGVPPEDPSLPPWQREAATLVHSWIYLLLLVVPLLGWTGVSLYPALDTVAGISLPALAKPNRPVSETVLVAHGLAAFALLTLIATHVGAALFHHFIRKDSTLRRMWPSLSGEGRRAGE
jgi:cytochrome b561